MEKIIRVIAMIMVVAVGIFTFAACADTSSLQSDIDSLKQQINSLEGQIDGLEEKVNEKANVFWTDKGVYSQTETMTVYYGKNAVFAIAIDHSGLSGGAWTAGTTINVSLKAISFHADILVSSILQTAYLESSEGVFMNAASYGGGTQVLTKGIEASVGSNYQNAAAAIDITTYYNLVICVPGTPFPLASFNKLTVTRPVIT